MISAALSFLSTPPSRVATGDPMKSKRQSRGFYPRHPRGWRLCDNVLLAVYNDVSIHATLAGGDP